MQAREGICDAALPGGARDAASVRIRRCLPCGQRRCRVARRIFGVSQKETGPGAFCPSGYLAGAPGNGAVARFPAGDGVVHRPAGGTRPLPPFLPHRPRAALPPLFAANIRRFVKTGFPSPAKSQLFALPAAASSPHHPAGRPAGSARTRSRVQTLENPFLGNSPVFPSPVPQNAAGDRPLLVGLPPSTRTIAPNGTHRSRPAPCSWGGSASPWSQRHWPPALPAHEGGQIFVGAQSAKVALQQQGAAYAVAAIAAAQAQ